MSNITCPYCCEAIELDTSDAHICPNCDKFFVYDIALDKYYTEEFLEGKDDSNINTDAILEEAAFHGNTHLSKK